MVSELLIERVEGDEVDDRDRDGDVEPPHKAERYPVQERQDDHVVQETEHTVNEFLEHTGVQADPQAPDGQGNTAYVQRGLANCHQGDRGNDPPNEDEPDPCESAPYQPVPHELIDAAHHVPAPKVTQEQVRDSRGSKQLEVIPGDT